MDTNKQLETFVIQPLSLYLSILLFIQITPEHLKYSITVTEAKSV